MEKGLFSIMVEEYFNKGLERRRWATHPRYVLRRSPGPRARLRSIWRYASIAAQLRAAGTAPAAIQTATPDNSFVHSGVFQGAKNAAQKAVFASMQRTVAERWLGMTRQPDGTWVRPSVAAWSEHTTLGHWSGYYGNAELILCETLQRALEASLGLDHQPSVPAPGDRADFQHDLARRATRVWPIYLFLTCPQPWFGAWVTWQCHNARSPLRGQVTVILQTPGHDRALTPSPVDKVGDVFDLDNPYYLAGVDPANGNSGYEGKVIDGTSVTGSDPVRAAVRGRSDQGMWHVTHENHDSAIIWRNWGEPATANMVNGRSTEAWELPPIATYRCAPLEHRADVGPGKPRDDVLEGYHDIVVISPSALDGGIPGPTSMVTP